MHPASEYSKSRGDLCQVASSHPPGAAAASVPPEFFLFVLFFDGGLSLNVMVLARIKSLIAAHFP
jgi:hypothetical protein